MLDSILCAGFWIFYVGKNQQLPLLKSSDFRIQNALKFPPVCSSFRLEIVLKKSRNKSQNLRNLQRNQHLHPKPNYRKKSVLLGDNVWNFRKH